MDISLSNQCEVPLKFTHFILGEEKLNTDNFDKFKNKIIYLKHVIKITSTNCANNR